MKPLLLVLLLAGLLAVAAVTSGPGPQAIRAMHPCVSPDYFGDISDNDSVGSEDAMLILREIADLFPHTTCPYDPDCDGAVNSVDALKILRYVAGMPYSQHEPCPDIGTVTGGEDLVAQYGCLTTVFGDIDGMGSVGPGDAMWILEYIAQMVLPEGGGGCSSQDVDCSGSRSAVDALKILRYVAGMPYSQHEPCPDIGVVVP